MRETLRGHTTAKALSPARPSEKVVTTGVALLLAVGYLALGMLLPGPAFFNVDANIKWLQASALAGSGWHSDGIADPSLAIDPSGALSPFRTSFAGAFFFQTGESWQGKYSPLFAWLNSAALALFGRHGLLLGTVLPALGALLVLARMARRMGLGYPVVPVLLLGLGTPLLFYGIVLWEHALGLLAALVATDAALDLSRTPLRRALVAGLAAGLAALLRTEYICLAPALGVVIAFYGAPRTKSRMHRRDAENAEDNIFFSLRPLRLCGKTFRTQNLLAGALMVGLALVPLALFNLAQSGTLLGEHLAPELAQRGGAGGLAALVVRQLAVVERLLLPQRFATGWLVLAPLAALSVVTVWRWRGRRAAAEAGAAALLATTTAALLWGMCDQFDSPSDLVSSGGVAVLALLWGLRRERTPADRMAGALLGLAGLFGALVLATLPNAGGDQWGPRYLLLIYPLLLLPAALGIERLLAAPNTRARRALLALALLVALGSTAVAAQSFAYARRWHQIHGTTVAAVTARPHSVLVTDSWGFPHTAALGLTDQALLGVEDAAQVRRLDGLLRAQGRDELVWVSATWRTPHHWQSAPTPNNLDQELQRLGWTATGPAVEDAAGYRYTVYQIKVN
ncbi:MAG TPA: hypothetical protein VFS21_12750 [Roseiflexaceae bacterium]|nr:hypothetical protein [Roseiflexaceae bacterium]